MRTIETNLNREGYHSDLEIGEGVITRLGYFLGKDDADAYKVLNDEVIEILDELDAEEKISAGNSLEEEIIIAVEDKSDASTYDSVVFNLVAEVDEFGYIKGSIK